MLPFLLPLTMARAGHGLDSIGSAIGAYNAGMLPAPLLGMLAERRRLYRPVFFGGFIALCLTLAAMPELPGFAFWTAVALLAGLGTGAVATVAPLFVVDFAPKHEKARLWACWQRAMRWRRSSEPSLAVR
jgi:MFS family permease